MRAQSHSKNLHCRHHGTHRRHAGSHPQQPSFHFCCAAYIICISAPMLMWVACKFIAYWSRTVEKQVCGNFCVLYTAISCFATVISWRAFLHHFPILFRWSSAKSSLYNTRTPQDCCLQFPATTTHCQSQNPTVDPVFVPFRSFASCLHEKRPPPRASYDRVLLHKRIAWIGW